MGTVAEDIRAIAEKLENLKITEENVPMKLETTDLIYDPQGKLIGNPIPQDAVVVGYNGNNFEMMYTNVSQALASDHEYICFFPKEGGKPIIEMKLIETLDYQVTVQAGKQELNDSHRWTTSF